MKSALSIRNSLLLSIALASAAACGGEDGIQPEPGNAYLSIVGDSNMFVDYGVQRVLTVRYHNSEDQPLSGEVAFAVRGESAGSTISAEVGYTDTNGMVEITLAAGQDDAAFAIEATAEYANPAVWNIAVGSPFDLYGTYDLDSNFDVVSGLPGDVGKVVNEVIDITDDPNDPALYLLEKIDEEFGFDGTGAAPIVNDFIKQHAPALVNDLIEISNQFGQVARNFGTDSSFRIAEGSGGEGMIATHTMRGFRFDIDNQSYVFTNADLGVEDVEVSAIAVAMDRDRVTLGAHTMPIAYGGFLALALEDIIIPLIDPSALSLYDFIERRVDCAGIGRILEEEYGFFSASTYEGYCQIGLQLVADAVIDQLLELDGVELSIEGTARMQETSGDRKVDNLTQGKWTGSIDYFGEAAALTGDANTFTGARVGQETD